MKPPRGWRWLEVGDILKKGDLFYFEGGFEDIRCPTVRRAVCKSETYIRRLPKSKRKPTKKKVSK